MNSFSFAAALSVFTAAFSAAVTAAQNEQGFVPLLDNAHLQDWRESGRGGVKLERGVWTTWAESTPDGPRGGVFCHEAKEFGDFVLRLSFKVERTTANSGIFLRIPPPIDPTNSVEIPHLAYEIDIRGGSASDVTGSILGFQPATSVRQKPLGQWNELEISVIGQEYRVSVNGKLVNVFKGDRDTSGLIGIQNHYTGPVLFKDVRIKELSPPVVQTPPVHPLPSAPVPKGDNGSPLTNGDKKPASTLSVLSQQAPNASAWILSALEQDVPNDIRQNLTFLREDLLDEAKLKPQASLDSYRLGHSVCSALLAALDERDKALVSAGVVNAEANARTGVTSQALEARRNYMQSWPQFVRESDQRDELKQQAINRAAVLKERPKVEWAARVSVLRKSIESLYAQFRDQLRQSSARPQGAEGNK